MNHKKNPSIEDIIKVCNNNTHINIKNYIFREFIKENDKYIATNKFYISNEIDNGIIGFNNFDILYQNHNVCEKITPYNEGIYIYSEIKNNNDILLKKYIDLIIISNISFSLEDIHINKTEIIKKFIEDDKTIDDKLFEELYFNNFFSEKINIELPKKYNNKKIIIENIEINKKYLFKINFLELNRTFYQENNLI